MVNPNKLPKTPSARSDKGVLRDKTKIKFFGVRAEGSTRSALVMMVGGAIVGIFSYAAYRRIKTKYDVKFLEAETWANLLREMAKTIKAKDQVTTSNRKSETSDTDNKTAIITDNEIEVRNWLENFDIEFPLNLVNFPAILNEYVATCPNGFEVPVLMALTASLALAFSMVEAKYLDGKYHRANIITITEGHFGSGKGTIQRMHDQLFGRRIKRDLEKVTNPDGNRHIIQTITPLATPPVVADILANNNGVHAEVFEPEIRTLDNALKQGNVGISYEIIRKAYDNDCHYRMNRDKNAPQGIFPIAINFILTGTPKDTESFLKKEIEGGTSSRMALCVLPNLGKNLPEFDMPEGDVLSAMQDQIDEWTKKYSYSTDDEGNDVPATIHRIDLSYVSNVLKDWLDGQFELGEYENNQARKDLRGRIASTVFNCAIVWHMLYDQPDARQRGERGAVVTLTLYMANYLMERWLHKFGKQHNVERAKFTAEEMVSVRRAPKPKNPNPAYQLPDDGLERGRIMWNLNQRENLSYDQIGKRYGLTKDQVSGYVRRYREKHGLKPDEEAVD